MPTGTTTRFDVNKQEPLPQAPTGRSALAIIGDDGQPALLMWACKKQTPMSVRDIRD